jgi:hypothetical protein
MARLAPSEVAEVVERILTLRPWVRPLAGIAAPPAIVGFVRQQLGDVRVHEQGWIATGQSDGIAVTSTPRLGVLAQPAVIPWTGGIWSPCVQAGLASTMCMELRVSMTLTSPKPAVSNRLLS